MKILYILGSYKPNMSANGVCSDNIINQLIEEGHEVTALVNAASGFPIESTDGSLKVHRVRQRLFLRLTEWCAQNKTARPLAAKLLSMIAFTVNKCQLLVMAPFWPVISPPTMRRFSRAAEMLYQRGHFDAVIAVYTPIEALHAGYALKKKHPEVWFVPYFLDSLSGGYGPKLFSADTTVRRGLRIEKEVFAAADKVVVMQSSAQHHIKYNGEFRGKLCFLDIPTLLRQSGGCAQTVTHDTIRLLYVGSISASTRNPDALIRCLATIADEDISCEFIGHIDCMEELKNLKEVYGDRLGFAGFLAHQKIAQKLRDADILLNIGNAIPTMVPSKIFEYMSYGKPVISTFSIDDEASAAYLRDYPLALLLDSRREEGNNKDKIMRFISEVRGRSVPFEETEGRLYLNTPKAFTRLVIQSLEENSAR